MSDQNQAAFHEVTLNRVPIQWSLNEGTLSFFGIHAAMFWLNPSLLRMLQPMADEVGTDLFRLLVAFSSSQGTEEDYHAMVTTLGSHFAEGFLAWGRAVSAAGWGTFRLPEFDPQGRRARVIVDNPWELIMQRGQEKSYGCPFIQGKIIGIFNHALGTNCWADEGEVVCNAEKCFVEFQVYASDRTIANEVKRLRSERVATLVQSEKMASLGQLIAGIAHEINTPMGAIQASIGTIESNIHSSLNELGPVLAALSAEERDLFQQLTVPSGIEAILLSGRDRRQKRVEIEEFLETKGIDEPKRIADVLVSMGIVDNLERYLPLLRHEKRIEIVSAARGVSNLLRASRNISTASQRVNKIIFALKSFVHIDSAPEAREIDIGESIDTVLTLYENKLKHGVDVVRSYDAVPKVLGYPDKLNQVWVNLIHNALQAMENVQEPRLAISVRKEQEGVSVCIRDNGVGISSDVAMRMFEPFFTTKGAGEGSGLGLGIVERIVNEHHGRVSFESNPGEGAAFTVWLPLTTHREGAR